ncbi:MAG TPA: L,D-transpeptidase family protein [Methylophilus sp.]|nr:L,D-transpeptidase family protein [Methylophilus sp.]HQQ33629.1 L,D-transpeptidase family protein [Methylophilus sp.]
MLYKHLSKTVKYCFIASCALLPWNATAVNHGNLAQKDLVRQLGRSVIDSLLVKSLQEISQGNTKQALNTINQLINQVPNFKLAHLIRGDLLSSQGQALQAFGSPSPGVAPTPSLERIEGLREEARTRIEHYFSAEAPPETPSLLAKMDDSQNHLIVVDTLRSRLFLYKKTEQGLKYSADYYVTIGKNGAGKNVEGDKRTPLGLYFAGKQIKQPLDDFYGEGAYPLNYPNELDQQENRTGKGIWLHGTPSDTYSRPPRASDGCVVLSNPDLRSLAPILENGNTPVIIVANEDWQDSKTRPNDIESSLMEELQAWRKDWAAQDTDAYLSHYSKQFFYSDGNLQRWADYKRSIQANKPKVSIELENISMFSYPSNLETSDRQIVVVNFEQDFRSSSLQNKMRKRQYWVYENKTWKILYEGAA